MTPLMDISLLRDALVYVLREHGWKLSGLSISTAGDEDSELYHLTAHFQPEAQDYAALETDIDKADAQISQLKEQARKLREIDKLLDSEG